MASHMSIRALARSMTTMMLRAPTTTSLLSTTTTTTTAAAAAATLLTRAPHRAFTTTPSAPARIKPKEKAAPNKGGAPHKQDNSAAARRARRAAAAQRLDPKTANIMKFIYAGSQVRAPLRMARQRHLRHWTIHRAWLLFRRKREETRLREMMRLHASMKHACETLRTMEGPGTRPQGYLFRKSMEKIGLWGMNVIPIEYARPLVETPGEKPWDHEWKRPSA